MAAQHRHAHLLSKLSEDLLDEGQAAGWVVQDPHPLHIIQAAASECRVIAGDPDAGYTSWNGLTGTWHEHDLMRMKTAMVKPHMYLVTGFEMTGPLPLMTSKSTPSAGSGVSMSENMMTPSGRNAFHGCNDNSIAMSAVSERCRKGILSENLHDGPTSASAFGEEAVCS